MRFSPPISYNWSLITKEKTNLIGLVTSYKKPGMMLIHKYTCNYLLLSLEREGGENLAAHMWRPLWKSVHYSKSFNVYYAIYIFTYWSPCYHEILCQILLKIFYSSRGLAKNWGCPLPSHKQKQKSLDF